MMLVYDQILTSKVDLRNDHYVYFYVYLFCGDQLWTSESDVYRRQIMTPEIEHRAVMVNVNKISGYLYNFRHEGNKIAFGPPISKFWVYPWPEIPGEFQDKSNWKLLIAVAVGTQLQVGENQVF